MYDLNLEILKINQYISNHRKDFNKEIGSIIKELRCNKKISYDEICTRTLMEPMYIKKIENGKSGIFLDKFLIICNALEINSKEILDDFLIYSTQDEKLIVNEFQKEKNIVKNILNIMKLKNG